MLIVNINISAKHFIGQKIHIFLEKYSNINIYLQLKDKFSKNNVL